MKYLINFGDKSIVLSRSDIAHLYPQLEPYFLSIMQGLGDVQTHNLVCEYKQFTQSLAQNRGNTNLTDEAKPAILEKRFDTETPSQKQSAKIYEFSKRRKKSDSTTKMGSR